VNTGRVLGRWTFHEPWLPPILAAVSFDADEDRVTFHASWVPRQMEKWRPQRMPILRHGLPGGFQTRGGSTGWNVLEWHG